MGPSPHPPEDFALNKPVDDGQRTVPAWERAAEVRRATRDESPHRRTRDTDVGGRSQIAKITTWSFLGGVVGGLLGVFGYVQDAWGIPVVVGLFALAWLISFVVPLIVSLASGRAARVMFAPSGRSTPRKRGHSQAESLVARGLYEEGIAAFREAVARDPRDAGPYLSIARAYRDKLRRFDDAVLWFKQALDRGALTPESRAFVLRELVELCVGKLENPAMAAPVLARYLERHPNDPGAEWASRELQRIKVLIGRERNAL